jgi:integrase
VNKSWPKIKRTQKNGKMMFLVDARIAGENGGGRRFFSSKGEAEAYAQTQRARRQNEGASSVVDAELAAFGWTVRQAIDFALEHLRAQTKSKPVEEALEEFLTDKKEAGAAKRYIYDLRLRLSRFAKGHAQTKVSSVTTIQINQHLQTLAAHPNTRNTHRRDLHTFFEWCKDLDLVGVNPVERARSYKAKPSQVLVLEPRQFQLLLESCPPEIRASVVLAGFCGIREAELKLLRWEAVDLEQRVVIIDFAVAKTNSRRTVSIPNAAIQWIETCREKKGAIIPSGAAYRTLWDMARIKAGFGPFKTGTAQVRAAMKSLSPQEKENLLPWPSNALRHSAISYRLALRPEDAAEAFSVVVNAAHSIVNMEAVAEQSGNSSAIIRKHYLKLVKPDAAKQWFSVSPPQLSA